MTDAEFLQQALTATRFLAEATPKQIVALKDINFKQRYCSPYLLTLMGAKTEDVLGKPTLLSLYKNDPEFEKILMEEDQNIIDEGQTKVFLKINQFTVGLMPYLCSKTPLINPSTQHAVGLILHGFELGLISLHQHLQGIFAQKSYRTQARPHLSKREKQVIFFFMANLNSQEIAHMLYQLEGKKVSKSTIDSLFSDQLYVKFGTYNRPALYKKLQMLGYHTLIPKENLSTTSLALETMQVY